MNKKTIIILFLVLLNLLSSCNSIQEKKEVEKKEVLNKKEIIKKEKSKEIVKKNNLEMEKKLQIDEKCIWCWKCAMVAPNNFVMDFDKLKAVVISQKNIFSDEVKTAIQICPIDSISIS